MLFCSKEFFYLFMLLLFLALNCDKYGFVWVSNWRPICLQVWNLGFACFELLLWRLYLWILWYYFSMMRETLLEACSILIAKASYWILQCLKSETVVHWIRCNLATLAILNIFLIMQDRSLKQSARGRKRGKGTYNFYHWFSGRTYMRSVWRHGFLVFC